MAPILIRNIGVLYEVRVYAGAACITVDQDESDNINPLFGWIPVDTELYLISTKEHAIEG